jgi:hypothetical protein
VCHHWGDVGAQGGRGVWMRTIAWEREGRGDRDLRLRGVVT